MYGSKVRAVCKCAHSFKQLYRAVPHVDINNTQLLLVYIPFNIIVSGTSKEKKGGQGEHCKSETCECAGSFVATVQHLYMHMLSP